MGLCYQVVRTLLDARAGGASFRDTLTVGRQLLHLHPRELGDLRRTHSDASAAAFLDHYQPGDHADGLFRALLAAETLTVLDHSDYDGAGLIHDLNQPVPTQWHERFDAVIDGGSLEHVFHFPNAVASLMEMTKVGGRVFLAVPANNECGHGLYQFSPELMFRVFAPENGFEKTRVVLVEAPYPSPELTSNRRAYEVTDPAAAGGRVGLMSRGPVMMIVESRRFAALRPFAAPPLQSDYAALWNEARSASETSASPTSAAPRSALRRLASRVYRALPRWLQNDLNGRLQRRRYSFANRRFYRRLPSR